MNPPELYTPRLRLRLLTLEDAAFVLALVNSPGWLRYIGDRGLRTLDDARRYLANGPIASYAQHGFGLLLVELRESRTPLGLCGLLRRETLPDVELGFAFAPEHEGRGYASEAGAAVVTHARERLGVHRLTAVVQPDNAASFRVLAKLGFARERLVRLTPDGVELQLLAREEA